MIEFRGLEQRIYSPMLMPPKCRPAMKIQTAGPRGLRDSYGFLDRGISLFAAGAGPEIGDQKRLEELQGLRNFASFCSGDSLND